MVPSVTTFPALDSVAIKLLNENHTVLFFVVTRDADDETGCIIIIIIIVIRCASS